MYQGVDTLQTDLGTKVTIGDGGLFSQPAQSATNADRPYEYGSSQNRLSISSTTAGLFYVSENQGKIFSYGEGLKEISKIGLKWWLKGIQYHCCQRRVFAKAGNSLIDQPGTNAQLKIYC